MEGENKEVRGPCLWADVFGDGLLESSARRQARRRFEHNIFLFRKGCKVGDTTASYQRRIKIIACLPFSRHGH